MDDPRWLRLITVGLVLAAVVVGYLLWTGKFSSSPSPKPTQVASSTSRPVAQMSPSPTPSATPTAVAVAGGQTGANTLPNTGFPVGLAGVFSLSAMTTGYFLRRFPK